MTYTAAGQLALAQRDVGYHEGPNNYNKYSKWQYGDYYEPWCASAVSYWAVEGGGFVFPNYYTFGWKGDNNVYWLGAHLKQQGLWRGAWTRARPGWLVLLSFTEPWQHTEMVLADQGPLGYISTIGGNTGDMVAYRTRYRSNIIGFGALDEAGQNGPPPPPKPPEDLVKPNDRTDAMIHSKGGRYVLLASGQVIAKDGAPHYGDITTERPAHTLVMGQSHAVTILEDRDGGGYWIGLFDGSVHTFGPAAFHGVFHKDIALPNLSAVRMVEAGDPAVGYKLIRSDGALASPR